MPAKERNRKTETTSHSPHRKLNPGGIDLKVSKVCNDSFFGEEDFFNNHPRSLTASVCSTRARVLRLDRKVNFLTQAFLNIIKELSGYFLEARRYDLTNQGKIFQ